METTPVTNRLLDRLPAKARERVFERSEEVELEFSRRLAEPGGVIRDVYFPTGSFVSLLVPVGAKSILEVALAGNEGLYGVPVALGIAVSPVLALVQGGGAAWRMEAATFRRELARSPELLDCVNRYTYVVMSQVLLTAGCNRFHVVEQRVARWLLMTADRAHANTFHLTHEFLAYMLGVRRVGITEAAGALQRRKLIEYKRGTVTLLDRARLEKASCSCYRTDISTYKAALGEAPRPASGLRRAARPARSP